MRHLALLVLALGLCLGGCGLPLTQAEARATAVAGGCWPLGIPQPATPLPVPTSAAVTPAVAPAATIAAYPACTPLPGQPTPTPRPTVVPTERPVPSPPPPPAAGAATLGQQPGYVTVRSRQVHTPALAVRPEDGRAAVAWISWGGGLDAYAGDVWVRAQGPAGDWYAAQTLNAGPVKSFFGGLGATWTVSDTLVVGYGDGGQDGATRLWLTRSADGGQSWDTPSLLGQGQLSDLASDAQARLHAVILAPGPGVEAGSTVVGHLRYGMQLAPDAPWQWSEVPAGLSYNARLALLPLPGGGLRRLILANDALDTTRLTLWSSDDGTSWRATPMPLRRFLPVEHPTATDLLAAVRADGSGLVVAAWSQPNGPGPVAGGVFAAVSLDGGATFGPEERIAQHRSDGSFGDERGGSIGAFEPALLYEARSDRVVVSYVEDDLGRVSVRAASSTDRVVRSRLAVRDLAVEGTDWLFARTPDGPDDSAPALTTWGVRGWLLGEAGHAWLVQVDERQQGARVEAAPFALASLAAPGAP
ncbi:MAG TPA: sialidase family protein [Roseiflexaceae bacterium]|nr:sialidase family protein [Roseiflexaceae bacterium]